MSYKEHKEGELTVRTFENGTKQWFLNGELHREDGPACVFRDGTKKWLLNGGFHREDGPAIEHSNGDKSWWLKDKLVYSAHTNNLKYYPDLTESFKKSIILYELQKN